MSNHPAHDTLTTFCSKDLVDFAFNCGYSVYRGVIVVWDDDHDERILYFLDCQSAEVLDQLLVVGEHEGGVSFLWERMVPVGYENGSELLAIDDMWHVQSSTVAHESQA